MTGEAVVGLHPIGPVVGQGDAVHADDLVARAPCPRRADLEAGREDDAIHWVLDTIRNDASLGDPFHALALAGINQLNVRAVEGWQIIVVEGRALTKLAIPGFQLLCDRR